MYVWNVHYDAWKAHDADEVEYRVAEPNKHLAYWNVPIVSVQVEEQVDDQRAGRVDQLVDRVAVQDNILDGE